MINHVTRTAAIAAVLLFFSCHPAKQIQKEDQDIATLKAKWIGEWVKDHPCPELPPVNLDSLCNLKDFAFEMTPGDTIKHDTIINRCQPVIRRILVPYQDTRTVELLYDSLKEKTERLAMLEGRQEGQDTAGQVQQAKENRNTWLWAFIAACVAILGLLAKDIYGLFKL